MNIQIAPHTLQRAAERGATEAEIKDTIESGTSILAKSGRLGKLKVYSYDQQKNGKYYSQKKIEVYYIIEQKTIVTVTVYVFYGKF